MQLPHNHPNPISRSDQITYTATAISIITLMAFYAAFWKTMGADLRLVLTLGGGIVLHILAIMAWQTAETENGLTILPGKCIFSLAAALQSLGWLVLFYRWFPQSSQLGYKLMPAMFFMLAQEALIYRHYRHNNILFTLTALAYGSIFACLNLLYLPTNSAIALCAASMLLLAHYLSHTRLHHHSPIWYALGGVLLYTPLITTATNLWAEAANLIALALGFTLAAHVRSKSLLWCTGAATCGFLAHITQLYVLSSPIWSIALPLLCTALYGCYRLTKTLQCRYLSSI